MILLSIITFIGFVIFSIISIKCLRCSRCCGCCTNSDSNGNNNNNHSGNDSNNNNFNRHDESCDINLNDDNDENILKHKNASKSNDKNISKNQNVYEHYIPKSILMKLHEKQKIELTSLAILAAPNDVKLIDQSVLLENLKNGEISKKFNRNSSPSSSKWSSQFNSHKLNTTTSFSSTLLEQPQSNPFRSMSTTTFEPKFSISMPTISNIEQKSMINTNKRSKLSSKILQSNNESNEKILNRKNKKYRKSNVEIFSDPHHHKPCTKNIYHLYHAPSDALQSEISSTTDHQCTK